MLELRNITKTFGAVLANDRVSIKVEPGTIHAIVGENGAGKSTAMRIAYGFYTADSGDIVIDGQVREIRTPHDAIALGVGMVHQHFMLVEPMTVAENIVLGAEPGNAASLDLRKAADEIRTVSDEFKLSVDPNAPIETLSVGQQQRVELLKALYRRARLLILDEPTAVLTPQEVEEFFAILRGMREQGKTIVIITHKLSEVLAISDNVTVMRDGRVVGEVKTSGTNAAELARLMVGREVLLRVQKPDAKPGENTILGVHYRKPAVTGPGLVFLDQRGIQRRTEQVIRDFDVRPPNPDLPARALSGGNQQKLIIGREFELPPKFLLVSQPTRGVDIGAIEFIHQKIVAMRDAGCAVLLVSAELEEVTALSDRLLVIHNGKIVGEVDPKVTSAAEIGLMMTGGKK